MANDFIPQMTTHGSFKEIEDKLYRQLEALGYSKSLAEIIAKTFTNYMLGYLTDEGAAQSILAGGATREVARSLAEQFSEARNRRKTGPGKAVSQ